MARIILSGCLVNCEFLKVFDFTELEKISAIYHLNESNVQIYLIVFIFGLLPQQTFFMPKI